MLSGELTYERIGSEVAAALFPEGDDYRAGAERLREALFAAGARDTIHPDDFQTGLDDGLVLAVTENNVLVTEILLVAGASADCRLEQYEQTALHYACGGGRNDVSLAVNRMAELLLAYGAPLDVKDGRGRLPEEVAWETGNVPLSERMRAMRLGGRML